MIKQAFLNNVSIVLSEEKTLKDLYRVKLQVFSDGDLVRDRTFLVKLRPLDPSKILVDTLDRHGILSALSIEDAKVGSASLTVLHVATSLNSLLEKFESIVLDVHESYYQAKKEIQTKVYHFPKAKRPTYRRACK